MENQKTQFVIQAHAKGDDLHWDMMIEKDGVLKTWRIPAEMPRFDGTAIEAENIFDHELRFLTYEGPVNKGKGTVAIVDSGVCLIASWNKNEIKGRFEGNIITGNFHLTAIADEHWELVSQ